MGGEATSTPTEATKAARQRDSLRVSYGKNEKHWKSLESLNLRTPSKRRGRGQQTRPTEQPRRRVKVTHKGCREERLLGVVELIRPYYGERHWRGSGEERECGWGRSGESQDGECEKCARGAD